MTFDFGGRQYDKDGLPIEKTPPPAATPQVNPSPSYQHPQQQAPFAQPQQQTPGFATPTPQSQPAPFSQPLMQQPGYGVAAPVPVGYQQKSWVASFLLAFFLGSFGVHNFYLGYSSRAKVQLLLGVGGIVTSPLIIGFLPLFIVGVWAFIEFIMILLSVGEFAHDAQGVPLQK